MKRYAIMVRDNVPDAHITELTQCDTNPMRIVRAAKGKVRYVITTGISPDIRTRHRIPVYDCVYAIDLATGERVDR